jgi:hypothetical protein
LFFSSLFLLQSFRLVFRNCPENGPNNINTNMLWGLEVVSGAGGAIVSKLEAKMAFATSPELEMLRISTILL